MNLDEHHYNVVGGVTGGAIFTVADVTFAVASNRTKESHVSLTTQITYLNRGN